MPADMWRSAEPSRLAHGRRVGMATRGLGITSEAGVPRGRVAVASLPLPLSGLPNLTTSTGVWFGRQPTICARTRGGGGFDDQQGVRRRCPALHRFRM